MKYAARGNIILRPHKAGKRRQTDDRPRQYLLGIPDSLVASQMLSIFKTLKKSSFQKWRSCLSTGFTNTSAFIPNCGQVHWTALPHVMGHLSHQNDPAAQATERWRGGIWTSRMFSGTILWLQFTLSNTVHFGHLYWNMRKSDDEYKGALGYQ